MNFKAAVFFFLFMTTLGNQSFAEEETSVSVTVEREELRYVKPCTWSLYEHLPYGAPRIHTEKLTLDAVAKVTAGDYLAVAVCPSSEGTLRQSKQFKVEAFSPAVQISFKMVPAFLMVEILKGRESLGAQVFVYDQWGIRIASGIDKAYMVVPSGKLWVYASTTDNDSSFDHKKIKTSATASLRPLQKQKLRLDVTPATLDVRLFNNGRNAQGVISLLTQGGKSVLDWDAGEKVTVPPGDYQITAELAQGHNFQSGPRKPIQLKPGRHQSLNLKYATGAIRPFVLLDGKRVTQQDPAYKNVEVALHRPGAPLAFNALPSGERAVLTPGAYDFVAQMKDRTLDDGSPWRVRQRIHVDARAEYDTELSLTPSSLELRTRLGEVGASVGVTLIRMEDDVKVYEGRSDANGRARLSLSPGGYRLQANPDPSNVKLTQEQLIDLKPAQVTRVELGIDLGRVMVQVFDDSGTALWCNVGLFRDGASKPSWVFRGGEEIWVPSGNYEIEVRRNGARQAYGTVRVSAGRTAERRVIWGDAEAPNDF